jgi:hypothetical protein
MPAPALSRVEIVEVAREEVIISNVVENVMIKDPVQTTIVSSDVQIKEEVFIPKATVTPDYNKSPDFNTSVGPEDPADDENNVCISCQ